ncbi:solute carrier organic anion transporter family, member 5A [Paragonimus westermani]|uniref:Solute carrier organic anion transporter family, member 5A n=1 Tax=Paragonimus westermani TaxID=34504 RepID=A0A5J4NTX9_9TREM|nr:solute carrier organic anion transporter family, member 5A [Paragonimus westermani]
MPTPYLSKANSEHSPALSGAPHSTADANQENKIPIDWNTNVVNFITNCRHPGLVRRTSSAAAHASESTVPSFKRRHRRNLSAATTVGYGRGPDTPRNFSKPSYSIFFSLHPQNNNFNSFRKSSVVSRPTLFGHTRNISDPTSCWQCYRLDVKPPGAGFLPDYPIHPLLLLSQQHSTASPDKIDDSSTSGELKSQASPYLPSWQKPPSGWEELDEIDQTDAVPVSEVLSPVTPDIQCLFSCLQPCATPIVVLLGLFFIMFVQTMVASGLISSMLTTLERRFSFTTRQVGYIMSCYEGSGVLTTVIISFVNGRKHNRLRIVGLATLLLAFGFALFALPHFIVGPYRPEVLSPVSVPDSILSLSNRSGDSFESNHLSHLCLNTTTTNVSSPSLSTTISSACSNSISQSGTGPERPSDPVHSLALLIFCVAMVLAGVGASPLHVLAPTYLWDNLSDTQYPIYSALFYSAGGLGPACGFLAGAGFLSVYIDSPLVRPRSGLTRNSPLWLGAWWMGMLVCAAITSVAALPVIAFPKRLSNDTAGAITDSHSQPTAKDENGIEEPPPAHSSYYMYTYHLPVSGAVVVPSSAVGILTGALLMRRYRPQIHHALAGMLVMIAATVLTTVTLMLLNCPGNRVAGLTATYDGKPWPWLYGPAWLTEPELIAPCNADCQSVTNDATGDASACSRAQFNPVCWQRVSISSSETPDSNANGPGYLTFFNPCFAGCQTRGHHRTLEKSNDPFTELFLPISRSPSLSLQEFLDCRCVTLTSLNPSGATHLNQTRLRLGRVTPGRCPADCPQYIVFLVVLFAHILFTGILQNPSNVITLSCVAPEDSSVALGLQLFFMRTLGNLTRMIRYSSNAFLK